jgi:predicted RNase H-like HicB family nuclease
MSVPIQLRSSASDVSGLTVEILELTIVISDDGAGYRATVREVPGCVAYGATFRELGRALEQAAAWWLDDPGLTLLYLELTAGEIAASAVPGRLGR